MTLDKQGRELLKELMDNENMSCRRLEKQSGVSARTIARVLSGETSPSLDTYGQILAGLGIEVRLEVVI